MKLAVCTTHPIQYQAPVWRHLAKHPDIELKVFFASDFSLRGYRDHQFNSDLKWDQPLSDGYDSMALGSGIKGGFFSLNGRGLHAAFSKFQPDVGLICAYKPIFYIDAINALRHVGARAMIRAEVTDADKRRSWLQGILKDTYARWIYSRMDCFLSIGSNATDHYLRLGVEASKIRQSNYNIDDELFSNHVALAQGRKAELKEMLGITSNKFVFICCGKYISKKNPLLLIKAFKALPESIRSECAVIFLGEGELRKEMESLSADMLGESIFLTGFVNQGDLWKYYGAGDCAVLPSAFEETWGLVVNEAMMFGLPCIVSDRVGCSRDLVSDETGYIFPNGDFLSLSDALQCIYSKVMEDADYFYEASKKRIEAYSSLAAARSIANAALDLE